MREQSLVHWLQQQQTSHPAVSHGIGDDGAVLACKAWSDAAISEHGGNVVVTTDLICDGVHFESRACSPSAIGHKAMAVNLSDLAAMAAEPVAAFVSLLLPTEWSEGQAKELLSATADLLAKFGGVVAGGDTNVWPHPLAINVALLGRTTPRGPLLRSGAQPDDVLLVTGTLGGSLRGKHMSFTPRVHEALWLHEHFTLHAGMDLSDGLALDLRRLASASNCGAVIDATRLPVSEDAKAMSQTIAEQRLRALGDGEDFELLLAMPWAEAERLLQLQPLGTRVTAVGHCTTSDAGLMLRDETGLQPMPAIGYEHRSDN